MGVFEYACSQCNHVTAVFVPLADRKPTVECEKCGAPAQFQLSATQTNFHANDRKAIKRSGH
jgi:putative FmdB family regulatory protein